MKIRLLVRTFNDIILWLTENKDAIIIGVIVEVLVIGIVKLWTLTRKIPKAIERFKNIKVVKYLEFILLYVLPLGTIIWMILDSTNEPTFRNISLIIIICISLVYNILMSHIISIYKVNRELISICSQNDATHKKAINILFESVGLNNRLK